MEARLGPSRKSIILALLHMNPITQAEEARTSHLRASNQGRAGVALPKPKFTLARDQSVPENGLVGSGPQVLTKIRRAPANSSGPYSRAASSRRSSRRGNWWVLPPINAHFVEAVRTRIDEVAVFKAQVVAPTFAALLVNLDQEDRLVLQALQVPSRHDRPGRL